jgi:MFS family permease
LTYKQEKPAGRWLMWAMLALAYSIVYIHRVAPSVVADQLMETFAVRDGAVLGSLAAVYFYVYMIMQLPSGLFADLLGPRATVSAGILVAAFGSLIFAAAPSIFLAFVGRFLVGLGVSVIFVCILKFHAVWFKPEEFAFVTGLMILVGNAGAMLASTPLALLVQKFGWRPSFMLIALMSVMIAIACWTVVRDAPYPSQSMITSAPLRERFAENLIQLGAVLKNFNSWPPFMVAFGLYGTLITFQGMWGMPYLMQVYGLSRTGAANLMLLVAAGMVAGSPLVGYLSDRLKVRKAPYLACVSIYILLWSVMAFWLQGRPPMAALYPMCFLFGFCGGAMTITFTLAKEVNPPKFAGSAVAVINSGGFLAIAILQPFLGYLLDLRWEGVMREGVKIYSQAGYALAFRFCLLFLAMAFIGALLVRETGGKNIYYKK